MVSRSNCLEYPNPSSKSKWEALKNMGAYKVNKSEWEDPTFIQAKNNGIVIFVSEFGKINHRINSKPFPIPKIQDVILKLEGFVHTSSLYIDEVRGSNPGRVKHLKLFQGIF